MVTDMLKRNRNMQTTTLEDRLIKFAEDARAAANQASPGRERDALIKKAEKAEAMSTAAERLLYAEAAFGKADSLQ
jgi:hypothetical protein